MTRRTHHSTHRTTTPTTTGRPAAANPARPGGTPASPDTARSLAAVSVLTADPAWQALLSPLPADPGSADQTAVAWTRLERGVLLTGPCGRLRVSGLLHPGTLQVSAVAPGPDPERLDAWNRGLWLQLDQSTEPGRREAPALPPTRTLALHPSAHHAHASLLSDALATGLQAALWAPDPEAPGADPIEAAHGSLLAWLTAGDDRDLTVLRLDQAWERARAWQRWWNRTCVPVLTRLRAARR